MDMFLLSRLQSMSLSVPNPEYTFQSLSEGKGIRDGQIVITSGFYSPGDGGGATYKITTDESAWSMPIGDGLYADIMNVDYVNYRMFGARLNGQDSDLDAMIKAHEYGNENRVKVKNSFGTIYKDSQDSIDVKYDVDLSGSEILITNDNFYAWYNIINDNTTEYSYHTAIDKSYLKKHTAYFPMDNNSMPRNVVIKIRDGNPWATRYDDGLIYEEFREELMVHHQEGLCYGPIIHGYDGEDTHLAQFSYTHQNNHRLTFKGCKIRVETTPNVNHGFLRVRRHNTHITDFIIDPLNNSLANVEFKGSIITCQDAFDIEISNIRGNNIAGKRNTNGKHNSGYIVRFVTCMKILLRNCNINGYWGATAATNIKDLTVRDCAINRIDVHDYFRDITIDNCTIYDWGVNLGYGVGTVTLTNSRIINYETPNIGGQTLFNINNTYGLSFEGNIIVQNVHMLKADLETSIVRCSYVSGENESRAKIKLPNLTVSNLYIQDIVDSQSNMSVLRFTGSTLASTTGEKIELPDFIRISNVDYKRSDSSNGSLKLLTDLTDGNMYSDTVVTEVEVDYSDFSSDALIQDALNDSSNNPVESETFIFNIYRR